MTYGGEVWAAVDGDEAGAILSGEAAYASAYFAFACLSRAGVGAGDGFLAGHALRAGVAVQQSGEPGVPLVGYSMSLSSSSKVSYGWSWSPKCPSSRTTCVPPSRSNMARPCLSSQPYGSWRELMR